jgi:hypothetical protein
VQVYVCERLQGQGVIGGGQSDCECTQVGHRGPEGDGHAIPSRHQFLGD